MRPIQVSLYIIFYSFQFPNKGLHVHVRINILAKLFKAFLVRSSCMEPFLPWRHFLSFESHLPKMLRCRQEDHVSHTDQKQFWIRTKIIEYILIYPWILRSTLFRDRLLHASRQCSDHVTARC